METPNLILQTYRFIFSVEFTEQLSIFAKVHEYDDRKTFKEEWTKWSTSELINEEIKRLTNNGFKGDIIDKMFKSARYYYRRKPVNKEKEDIVKTRKPYESISKEIMEHIDAHIYKQINNQIHPENTTNNYKISSISPAESFDNYLLENKQRLAKELTELKEVSESKRITKEDCENLIIKYKKTYKNRFYKIRVNLHKELDL